MMYNIFQTILVLLIFITVKYLVWKITEKDKVPQFLHYMPYICYKCAQFWSLMALFISCGLLCHLWITMVVGVILTALDTIALHIHEKNNTISIKDLDFS